MRGHAALILFIVTMIIAAGAVILLTQRLHEEQGNTQPGAVATSTQPKITGVSIWGVTDREAKLVRIQVTGGETVNISETLLRLQTRTATDTILLD